MKLEHYGNAKVGMFLSWGRNFSNFKFYVFSECSASKGFQYSKNPLILVNWLEGFFMVVSKDGHKYYFDIEP